MPVGTDLVTPLWRGVVLLRIVTAALAVGGIVVHHDSFARPDLGWIVLAGIAVWTVVTCLAYSFDVTRRIHMIVLDLMVTLALMASSVLVLSPDQLSEVAGRAPLLTTVWATGPVVAAAVHAGRIAGVVFGGAVSAVNVWSRGSFSTDLARDTVLLMGAGFVIGLAATTARRATERLRRAARAEAATAERERLAMPVYEGVLQVLGLVRSRGGELGGEFAELGRLAGQQETILRSLISAAPSGAAAVPGDEDLASALRLLAGSSVDVEVPVTEVPLPASDVEELVAVTREALAGTAEHTDPDTRAWVLVEDLGEEVVLTIRGVGAGLDDGHATGNGSVEVSRSIRARVADLGGTLTLDTHPGQGTEWQVRLTRTRPELPQ